MPVLFCVREDFVPLIATVRLIQGQQGHVVFCFPMNPSFAFLKTLVKYPHNTTYDAVIYLLGHGPPTQISNQCSNDAVLGLCSNSRIVTAQFAPPLPCGPV